MRSAVLLAVVTVGLPLLVASCKNTSEPQTVASFNACIRGRTAAGGGRYGGSHSEASHRVSFDQRLDALEHGSVPARRVA